MQLSFSLILKYLPVILYSRIIHDTAEKKKMRVRKQVGKNKHEIIISALVFQPINERKLHVPFAMHHRRRSCCCCCSCWSPATTAIHFNLYISDLMDIICILWCLCLAYVAVDLYSGGLVNRNRINDRIIQNLLPM